MSSFTFDRSQIFQDLSALCSFNSVHTDPALVEECAGAATLTENLLREAAVPGLKISTFDAVDGSRVIVGKRAAAPGKPTVLLYSHYDVVPAGDHAQWTTDPFTLSERDGRWYARGAADCKGNLAMHLATLRAVGSQLDGLGLTVLIEGSEEMGGEGLEDLLRKETSMFEADAILIADSGNVAVGVPTITTSLRGGAQVRVRVDTLRAPVHSGGFGGAAPDAVAALVRLLDTLRDEHGRTQIDGVNTTGTWSGQPYPVEDFRADAGVLDGVEVMGTSADGVADMLFARPAISITGFSSTAVDKAVNAVPATAQAQLNLRVPAGMDSAEVAEKLRQHLLNNAPWGAKVQVEVSDANKPFSTDPTGPALQLLAESLRDAYGVEKTALFGSGGSIPLTTTLQELFPNAEIAIFGVEEPLSTIHSPDESVDPNEIITIAEAEANFLLAMARS